jgi:hypothetical protein
VPLSTDSGALQLATHDLKQGLPGTPKRVGGIGSAAYDAIDPVPGSFAFRGFSLAS